MLAPLTWKKIPIFISSTFRDMYSERDHLMQVVFPELQERLRKHRCYIEPIDLRWGVETSSVAEVEAKNLRILQICAEEIQRSRPFQIVLLGDRYGTIPPAEQLATEARRAGLGDEIDGLSVTAFEIEVGIRGNNSVDQCCITYCRDGLSIDGMKIDTAALFADDPTNLVATSRLSALKARLQQLNPERFRAYRAKFDEKRQQLTDLEPFGRLVIEDLWRELEGRIAQYTIDLPKTWEERQDWQIDESNSDHLRQFVGRVEFLAQLRAFTAASTGPWGRCLIGEAGCGKSAILAKLANELRNESHLVLMHCVEAVENGGSTDLLLRRWIRQLEEFLGDSPELPDDTSAERLDERFAHLLTSAAERTRVVVLLDAIDRFESTDRGRFLTWLPRSWPDNARLVAACQPCDASWTLEVRDGCRVETVPDISRADASAIVDAICAKYHRTLNDEIRSILLDRRDANGKPACANPLWLTLVAEYINGLEAENYLQAGEEAVQAPEQRLLRVLSDAVQQVPADLAPAYQWLLGRAQKRHGDAALLYASLFCVSEVGWRVSDLRKLMVKFTGKAWSELDAAALRRTFRQHLAESGDGHWDFRHGLMRLAIHADESRLPVPIARLHAGIADYLETLPEYDVIRCTALMNHYLGSGDLDRAARHLSSELGDQELNYAVLAIARSVIAKKPDIEWLNVLLGAGNLDRAARLKVARRVQEGLSTELARAGETSIRAAVIGHLCDFWRRFASKDDSSTLAVEWARSTVDLARAHRELGNVATAFSKYQEALPVLERVGRARAQPRPLAERSLEAVLAENPGDEPENHMLIAKTIELATACYCGIGDLFAMEGQLNLEGAQGAYSRAATIKRSAETERSLDLLLPLRHGAEAALLFMRIAYTLLLMGSGSGAIGQFRFALSQLKQFAELDPSNSAVRREIALLLARQAQALLWESAPGAAVLTCSEAVGRMEELIRRDPSRRSWQIDVAYFRLWGGDALDKLGHTALAQLNYRKAHDMAARVAAADPDNKEWQKALGDIRRRPIEPLDPDMVANEAPAVSFSWDYDPLTGMRQVDAGDGTFVSVTSSSLIAANAKALDPIEAARRITEARSGPRFNDWQASLGGAQVAVRHALAGNGGPFSEKLDQLRHKAEAGDREAELELGTMYLNGTGIPRDAAKAKLWLSRSAEQGAAMAQYNLGVLLWFNEDGLQNQAEAVRWWRLAAESGLPEAQYNLGEACSRGVGTERDPRQAAEWMYKAAHQGFASAQYNLGLYLAVGFGLATDQASAADWYRRAAEQGVTSAKHNLAILYMEGKGIKQDLQQGLDYLHQAAKDGLPASQYTLATLYLRGQWVGKNEQVAVALLGEAAKAGFEPACTALRHLEGE